MKTENVTFGDYVLNIKGKFGLLQNNLKNFSLSEQLSLAATLRDKLGTEISINPNSDEDREAQISRERLINEINDFIKKTISSVPTIKSLFNPDGNYQIDYSNAKDELLGILDRNLTEFNAISGDSSISYSLLPKWDLFVNNIKSIKTKCINDKYTILLLGEYQSGKTTTFDSICGGNHIGPIGDGTKTSAIPISLKYSERKEVNVMWKNTEDFICIFSSLKRYFPNTNIVNLNFGDESSRARLLNQIESIRKNFKKIVLPEEEQLLILFAIMLYFWNSKTKSKLSSGNISTSEIEKYSRFPKKMKERWEKHGVSSFSEEESIFIFIKKIEFGYPSLMLSDLNVDIMDCPGLFASSYDTQVTQDAIIKSDAILYIFPRERQAGEQIEESLKMLKGKYSDFKRKLIFANNLSFCNPNSKAIFEANLASVKRCFGEDSELDMYDAYLAYLGAIKNSFDAKTLDSKTEMAFIESCQTGLAFLPGSSFDNFTDAWNSKIRMYNTINNGESALKVSRLPKLLITIKSFVELNKAYSLIVSSGAAEILSKMILIQNDATLSYIEPYVSDREKLINLWKERCEKASSFDTFASTIASNILFKQKKDNQTFIRRLSDYVYLDLFTEEVYDSMSDKISDRLFDEVNEIKKIKNDETKLKKFTSELVTSCISEIIYSRVQYWNDKISSGNDAGFNGIFSSTRKDLEKELNDKWEELYKSDITFKTLMDKYYDLPSDIKKFRFKKKSQSGDASVDKGAIATAVVINYGSIATMVTGLVGGYAVYLAVCAGAGPIGWLLGGLGLVIAGIFGADKIDEYNKKKFKKKINPGLKEQLENSGIKSSISTMIYDEINRIITNYKDNLGVDFDQIIKDKNDAISSHEDKEQEIKCFKVVEALSMLAHVAEEYNNFLTTLESQ